MRIQDLADILIMSVLVYQLYIWFRRTRALQVVIGLGVLAVVYIITKQLELFMTSWILQQLGTVIFILIIVVFQAEIRQALYRISLLRNFLDHHEHPAYDIAAIASTVFAFADKLTGAIIVFEGKEVLDDHLLQGVALDSVISPQLLISIFDKNSPLHDGAVVVRNGRISEASSHLPLSASTELPQHLGTRHRAAIGLSERSDALVVVVSEERGVVSVAIGGELYETNSVRELENMLVSFLETAPVSKQATSFTRRVFHNSVPKLVTLTIVIICWLLINGRQGGVQTVAAQLKFHNLPEQLAIKDDLPADLEVQLKFFSTLFTVPGKMNIVADLDLSRLHPGVNSIVVDSKVFQLPMGVSVAKVTPAVVKIVAEKRVYRELPVFVQGAGRLPRGLYLKSTEIIPSHVTVFGAESELAKIKQIQTLPIDYAAITNSRAIDVRLLLPLNQLQINGPDSVKVKLNIGGRRRD